MSKAPGNNILYPEKPQDIWKHAAPARFNTPAHEAAHIPRSLMWTSSRVLSTNAGSAIYLPRPGMILAVRANVQTAPTGTLTWTVLKNGTSIFATSPTIGSGLKFAAVTSWIDNGVLYDDDFLQVQITTVNSAVGPMVVIFDWIPVTD